MDVREYADSRMKNWDDKNFQKMKLPQLKKALDYWSKEQDKDFERLDPKGDDISYLRAYSALMQSSIVMGVIEKYYIIALEKKIKSLRKS